MTTQEDEKNPSSNSNVTKPALISYDFEEGIATLSMQYRPYNLIGEKLLDEIINLLMKAKSEGARAIIISSNIRHFSAGAELAQFTAPSKKSESSAEKSYIVDFLSTMELFPIPIIASVHGVCLGGGLELALACDYIIAADSAKFGSVEVTLGLNPLMGAVQRQVQRIGTARAKEMSMLGRRYDATTLETWGLINLVVADDQLKSATQSIAAEFAAGPTISYAATKALAYIAANEGVKAADEAMETTQKPIWRSQDLKTGLASFAKNGPGQAIFKGE